MTRVLFACGTDNDGYPTCMGDMSTCAPDGKCHRLRDEILEQEIREQLADTGADSDTIDEVVAALELE